MGFRVWGSKSEVFLQDIEYGEEFSECVKKCVMKCFGKGGGKLLKSQL